MMFVQNKKGLLGLALILCFVAVVLIVAESEGKLKAMYEISNSPPLLAKYSNHSITCLTN